MNPSFPHALRALLILFASLLVSVPARAGIANPPDLAPAAATLGDPASSGEIVEVSFQVSIGEFEVPNTINWQDDLYLSSDEQLDVGDVLLVSAPRFGPIPAYTTYTETQSVTLPFVAPGGYYLIVKTDRDNMVYETEEGNNISSYPVTIVAPDLHPTAGSFTTTASAGEEVGVSFTIANQGTGDARANREWYDRVYLSTDTNLDPSDTPLTGYIHHSGPFEVSDSYTENPTVTLPAVAPGTYYLIVSTDDNYLYLYESDENNNVSAYEVTIVAPDLHPIAGSFTATASAGEDIGISYTVVNQGSGPATANRDWYDRVYLSTDANLDPSDTPLTGYINHSGPLVSGDNYTENPSVTLPAVAPGTYYLIVSTDDNYLYLYESDEFNNTAAFEVNIVAPDLRPTTGSFTATASAGEDVGISYTVVNQGSGPATANRNWYDRVYLSTDTILDPSDAPLTGYIYHSGLFEASDSYTENTTVTVPTVAPGTYYLIVSTDDNYNFLFESDENNNIAAFEVTIVAPDLHPTAGSITDTPSAGESVQISFTVTNQGSGPATANNNWVDRVHLSTDAMLDPSDTPLTGFINHSGPLEMGDSYTENPTVTIPAVAPGTYFLIVSTDDNYNFLFESDEGNNIAAFEVTIVAPDLTPTYAYLDRTGFPGESFELSYFVTNQGTGPAPASQSWTDRIYFSSDEVLDPGDTLLFTHSQSGPLPGNMGFPNFYLQTNTVTLPNVPLGDYFLVVQTDLNDTLFEGNESNNLSFFPVRLHETYDHWATLHGLSGEDADHGANPQNDGIENLLKYAFNLDPNTSYGEGRYLTPETGLSGLPSITVTPSRRLRIEYLRRRNAEYYLQYLPQFARDPGEANEYGWQPPTEMETVTIIDDRWERVVVLSDDYPVPPVALFGRVFIQLNPPS